MDGWIDECINALMDAWIDGCMDEWMNGKWLGRLVDESMDRWMANIHVLINE